MIRLLTGLAATLGVIVAMPLVALIAGAEGAEVLATLGDAEVWAAIGMSVVCAAFATAVGLVLGVPAGYLLARRRVPAVGLWQTLIDLPVVIPHPVIGLGLLLIFAHRSLVGPALHDSLGLDVASAVPGIVLAMVVVSAPFIVKAARDGFAALDIRYEHAAATLGASEATTFIRVVVPMAAPSIASGATLAWARAVSEFGSIAILAYYPRTAPVLIWDRFSTHGLRSCMAPALLLMLVCAVIFFLLHGVRRRVR